MGMVRAKSSREEKKSSKKRFRFWIFITKRSESNESTLSFPSAVPVKSGLIPVILLGLCLFFGAVFIIWLYLQRPAIGKVWVVEQTPTEDKDSAKKQKQYQGKYLTFSYPSVYAEKSHEAPVTGPVKESIFLSAEDFEGRKIAIIVEGREAGNFEASPSFQMRLNKPKEYEKSSFSENGFEGFLFTKNSRVFEQTALFFVRSLYISISFTSPFTIEGLHEELLHIFKSLEIKE